MTSLPYKVSNCINLFILNQYETGSLVKLWLFSLSVKTYIVGLTLVWSVYGYGHRDMRLDMVLEFGYREITYMFSFLVLNDSKVMSFL